MNVTIHYNVYMWFLMYLTDFFIVHTKYVLYKNVQTGCMYIQTLQCLYVQCCM